MPEPGGPRRAVLASHTPGPVAAGESATTTLPCLSALLRLVEPAQPQGRPPLGADHGDTAFRVTASRD